MSGRPNLTLSHFEINVSDATGMGDFYSRVLGFVVTDRGEGPRGLVFLSRNPHEHHQIVLNPGEGSAVEDRRMDHISFRVAKLAELRVIYRALAAERDVAADTVSHGNSWSIYFRDPEGNRLEIFTDTPWHVDQPCRFEIDLSLDDRALMESTEARIRTLPGFRQVAEWRRSHASKLGGA